MNINDSKFEFVEGPRLLRVNGVNICRWVGYIDEDDNKVAFIDLDWSWLHDRDIGNLDVEDARVLAKALALAIDDAVSHGYDI